MATIGQQLKAAREAKGVTEQEAGRVTKILTRMIREMEADDFSSMAAPAYAKGFIRMYARYLGLDADALVQQYAEVQSGGSKALGDGGKARSASKTMAKENGVRTLQMGAGWLRTLQAWVRRQAEHLPALAKRFPTLSLQDIRVRAAAGAIGIILIVLLIVIGNCARRQAAASRTDEQTSDDLEFLMLDDSLPDLYLVEPGRVERVQ